MPIAEHVRAEVEQILAQWNAGKEIRSLELGHSQEMEMQPDGQHRIVPREDRHDQAQLHAYAFALIEAGLKKGVANWDDFVTLHTEIPDLSQDGLAAAESLAWKALTCGWVRAMDGYKDAQYIMVKKPMVSG